LRQGRAGSFEPMRMLLSIVTLPVKLTFEVASRVVGLVRQDEGDLTTVSEPPEPSYFRPRPQRSHGGNGGAPPVRRVEPEPEPRPEPAHVSEEPELVAETAEAGAEEGAGAEVRVEEPWPGYSRMNAADIRDRLRVAPAAEAAAVSLYEAAGKGRSSVLQAASRRVRVSEPPSA
jgi:hypothetical protein